MEQLLRNPMFIFSVFLWSIPWKGYALWKAAQLKQKGWFIFLFAALFLFNTFGLLDILYIFILSKQDFSFLTKYFKKFTSPKKH